MQFTPNYGTLSLHDLKKNCEFQNVDLQSQNEKDEIKLSMIRAYLLALFSHFVTKLLRDAYFCVFGPESITDLFSNEADQIKEMEEENNEEILDEEGELIATEISSLPSKVKDTKPVHVSVAILQHAKLLFLRFMWFLFDHLEPGSFRSVYADTDR